MAQDKKLRGAIFDLDGTLGDSVSVSLEAFRRTYREFSGKQYSDDEILATWGPSEEGVMQRMYPQRWQEAVERYLRYYDEVHVEQGVAGFEGFEAIFDLFDQYAVHKAIVTAKGQHSAAISLRHFGLAEHFEIVKHGSTEGVIKGEQIAAVVADWGLSPDEVIYVGDFPSDIAASRQAGVVAVGAAWSPTADAATLAAYWPDYLFTSTWDFKDMLEGVLAAGRF